MTVHYLAVIDKVHTAGLDAQISVKPTQLGLDLDYDLCFRNLQRLIIVILPSGWKGSRG